MTPKKYDPFVGVQLDASFLSHKAECDRCRRYDDKPATLQLLCLEGSVLLKGENVARPVGPKKIRDEHYGSKKAVQAAMRYK